MKIGPRAAIAAPEAGKGRAKRGLHCSAPGGGEPGAQAGGSDKRLRREAEEQIGSYRSGSESAVRGLRE